MTRCDGCRVALQHIFRKDRDQRDSIIDEVCNIFSRLPTTKSRSRTFQIRLSGDETTDIQVSVRTGQILCACRCLPDTVLIFWPCAPGCIGLDHAAGAGLRAPADSRRSAAFERVQEQSTLRLFGSPWNLRPHGSRFCGLCRQRAEAKKTGTEVDLKPPTPYPGMADAQRTVQRFVNKFVDRCKTATAKDAAEEARALFTGFVEDVLKVLDLPEWPSAALVCSVLWARLYNEVPKSDAEQSSLSGFAIKLLGRVLAGYENSSRAIGAA